MKIRRADRLVFAAVIVCTALCASAPARKTEAPPEAKADPIHGLAELARRTRVKPHELLRAVDGAYPSERVIFRDRATGAELWKMSRNPGCTRHHYPNFAIWNADGSQLMLRSRRPGDASAK